MKNFRILGVRIDSLSRAELEQSFVKFLGESKFHHVATVNPEFLVEAKHNPDFKNILNKTVLNLCDGFGIQLIQRILGKGKIERITGVEAAEILCQTCAREGKSIFFLGGFGVANQAAQAMKQKFPTLKIAGTLDGERDKLSNQVVEAKPDAILVAFGAPTQEIWLQKFADQIPSLKIGMGVGGTFDFWAGKVKRSPKLLQKLGLEWLWRLGQEPVKRGKRIFRAVFVFPWLVIKK